MTVKAPYVDGFVADGAEPSRDEARPRGEPMMRG
jgi:hypothetical protein